MWHWSQTTSSMQPPDWLRCTCGALTYADVQQRKGDTLTFEKLLYPKRMEQAEDNFDPTEIFPIWADYHFVHRELGRAEVKLTQDCLVRNLLEGRTNQLWVEVEGEMQLVNRTDLEMGN